MDEAAKLAGKGMKKFWDGYWNDRFHCAPEHTDAIMIICCKNTCGGIFAVYRFSWVLCLFFTALMFCTIGTTKFGAKMHRGFWFLKVFILLGLLIAAVFVDNHAMAAYREFARFASMLFLLVQIVLLIDFGYRTNEWLVELDDQSDNDNKCCNWKMAILGGAVVLYAAAIAMWALQGHFFGADGCAAQQTLISLTVLLCVA